MSARSLRILSNLPALSGVRTERFVVDHVRLDPYRGWRDIPRLLGLAAHCDVVLLNIDAPRLLALCLCRYLMPGARWRLVSLDVLLARPTSWPEHLSARMKRLLLRKVDRFVLYFRDVSGYERYYGVSSDRVSYVPFKVNVWSRIGPSEMLSSDGSYVLAAGRTLRDLATFSRAMRVAGYPGLLLYQGKGKMSRFGTTVPFDDLPANVTLIEHDGNQATWVEYMRGAKVVVLATVPGTISATGISTCMDAMGLKKCVILTEGPATRGVFDGEAIVVPPADPEALASAIRRVWEDDVLRDLTAQRGRRFAEQAQDETRLLRDVLDLCGDVAFETVPPADGRTHPPSGSLKASAR